MLYMQVNTCICFFVTHTKMLDERMKEIDPDFRYRGLEQTPCWRWLVYGLLFVGAVAYLGFKFDRTLLVAVPIGGAFVIAMFFGMDRLFKNPRGRAWLLRNLVWLILIFIVGKIALFVWDRIEERKEHGSSNQALHGTADSRADAAVSVP